MEAGGLVTSIIAPFRESKLEDAYEQDCAKIKTELERFQSIGSAQKQVQSDIQKLMNATEARDELIKKYVFRTINETHISITETSYETGAHRQSSFERRQFVCKRNNKTIETC